MFDFQVVVEFIISVLLAFIVFTIRNISTDTKQSLKTAQENQVAIRGLDSKLDGVLNRLERLEDQKDQEASDQRREV